MKDFDSLTAPTARSRTVSTEAGIWRSATEYCY
jgi:hypothetical protein